MCPILADLYIFHYFPSVGTCGLYPVMCLLKIGHRPPTMVLHNCFLGMVPGSYPEDVNERWERILLK